MTADNIDPVDRRILSRTFAPIGRILNQQLQRPIFFLTLHPEDWRAQYYGILIEPDERKAVLLKKLIHELVGSRSRDFQTLKDVLNSIQQQGWAASDLLAASVYILYQKTVQLACDIHEGTWFFPGAQGQTNFLTWFQQTLDFANKFNFTEQAFSDFVKETECRDLKFHCPFGEGKKRSLVIEVLQYLTLPNLVNSELFEIYVAEYFYSVAGRHHLTSSAEHSVTYPSPEKLSHYFMPLSGLGQWRAAICWIGEDSSDREAPTLLNELSSTLHQALNELCSQALVDVFSYELLGALAASPKLGARSWLARLANVFAFLWWSDEISFYQQSSCRFRLTRGNYGRLEESSSLGAASEVPQPFTRFLTYERLRPGRHQIQIDLSQILDSTPSMKTFGLNRLGFDRVLFEVRLFESPDEYLGDSERVPHWQRIEDLLQERISQVLRLVASEASRSRAEALEAISHSMKHTLRSTGWRHSLEGIRKIVPQNDSARILLQQTLRSLAMFQIVEAVYDLQDLDRICERRWYHKLEWWTNQTQLRRWESATPDVYECYGKYICRFISLICSGHDIESFYFRMDPKTDFATVSVWEEDFRSVETWIRELGPLPPLAMNRGQGDSHLALLATLHEPVVNAAKHSRPAHVYVTLASSLPAEIDVTIANKISGPLHMKPTGIEQARILIERTGLATIESAEVDRPQGLFYEITVRLHPHRLAGRILSEASRTNPGRNMKL